MGFISTAVGLFHEVNERVREYGGAEEMVNLHGGLCAAKMLD